jgi:hypothetical protein
MQYPSLTYLYSLTHSSGPTGISGFDSAYYITNCQAYGTAKSASTQQINILIVK